jgi:long-chain acyl-CoA synthetase
MEPVSDFAIHSMNPLICRINAAIKTQLAAGGLKGALLKKAVDAKLHNWRTTGEVNHRLYDALVFRKVFAYLVLYT